MNFGDILLKLGHPSGNLGADDAGADHAARKRTRDAQQGKLYGAVALSSFLRLFTLLRLFLRRGVIARGDGTLILVDVMRVGIYFLRISVFVVILAVHPVCLAIGMTAFARLTCGRVVVFKIEHPEPFFFVLWFMAVI